MADFSYDTVRRAAQEAVGNLHATVSELKNNIQTWRYDSRTTDTQTRIYNIERVLNDSTIALQRIETTLQQVHTNGTNHETWRQQFDPQKFEQRIANMEKFASDISRYLQELNKQIGKLAEASARRYNG